MSDSVRKNILIVEPERDTGELYARALESRRDCKCYIAATRDEAFDLLKDIPFDLMLLDMTIAMVGDFGLLRKLKREFPLLQVIVDAYLHQTRHLAKALEIGIKAYFIKPVKIDLLRQKIDECYVTCL